MSYVAQGKENKHGLDHQLPCSSQEDDAGDLKSSSLYPNKKRRIQGRLPTRDSSPLNAFGLNETTAREVESVRSVSIALDDTNDLDAPIATDLDGGPNPRYQTRMIEREVPQRVFMSDRAFPTKIPLPVSPVTPGNRMIRKMSDRPQSYVSGYQTLRPLKMINQNLLQGKPLDDEVYPGDAFEMDLLATTSGSSQSKGQGRGVNKSSSSSCNNVSKECEGNGSNSNRRMNTRSGGGNQGGGRDADEGDADGDKKGKRKSKTDDLESSDDDTSDDESNKPKDPGKEGRAAKQSGVPRTPPQNKRKRRDTTIINLESPDSAGDPRETTIVNMESDKAEEDSNKSKKPGKKEKASKQTGAPQTPPQKKGNRKSNSFKPTSESPPANRRTPSAPIQSFLSNPGGDGPNTSSGRPRNPQTPYVQRSRLMRYEDEFVFDITPPPDKENSQENHENRVRLQTPPPNNRGPLHSLTPPSHRAEDDIVVPAWSSSSEERESDNTPSADVVDMGGTAPAPESRTIRQDSLDRLQEIAMPNRLATRGQRRGRGRGSGPRQPLRDRADGSPTPLGRGSGRLRPDPLGIRLSQRRAITVTVTETIVHTVISTINSHGVQPYTFTTIDSFPTKNRKRRAWTQSEGAEREREVC
ncbi:MAG: hypothetical protein Q9166_004895 [cf. Caloplaca sp. 2 TL-2023]